MPSADERPQRLIQLALWLAYATVAWNVVEAVVAVAAGLSAGSVALLGFGLDSTVETLSAVVVIWRLRGAREQREARALQLIGISFFVLAAYVGVQSVVDLIRQARPDPSAVGIGLAGLSLLVMPALATGKRRVGTAMASRVVLADAVETLLCAYLSAALLVGLVLNAALGWWWADPVAGLVIAWLALREGREAFEEEDEAADADGDAAVSPRGTER